MTPPDPGSTRPPEEPEPAPSPRRLPHLIDERSDPDFRTLFGTLTENAVRIDVAVTRIRLGAVDLSSRETRSVEELRVLVAEVNASIMSTEVATVLVDERRATNIRLLARLIGEKRLSVRSAPLAGWAPDFSVFHGRSGPSALLLGPHWFERPYPHHGPAFASLHGAAGAALAGERFERLWERAHDIGPAIQNILEGPRLRRR
jgi:hypothetical protein